MKIYFTRKNANRPLYGCALFETSKNTEKKFKMVCEWIENHKNGINIKLDSFRDVFFDDMKQFCESNDLDYTYPLHIEVHKNVNEENVFDMIIEQVYTRDFIKVTRYFYSDIKCEINEKRCANILSKNH